MGSVFTARCTLVQSAVLRSHVVCLSVTLVDCDHIGWNSSEIISRLVSLECSLSADPNISGVYVYSKGNTRKCWPTPCWFVRRRHSIANCGRMVTDSATVTQWRAYRKPPSLFRMVPSMTPYDLLFPQNRVPYAPRYANGHISATGDPIHFMFGSRVRFSGSADRMALYPVTSNQSWRQAAILDNLEWPYLRNGSFDPLI